MFRSLFARMLITISTVLTVSFLILSVILASFANEYELDKRKDDLERTAVGAANLLTDGLGLGEEGGLSELLSKAPDRYKTYFSVYLSNTEETVLLLCDPEGKILLSDSGNTDVPDYRGAVLPAETVGAALGADAFCGTLPLFEEGGTLLCSRRLGGEGEGSLGFVLTFSTASTFGGMTTTLIRTVLLASLWIILGALVIMYFAFAM